MKRGFTMIELIFVIVVIGILAAIAIAKIAATRDDARISVLVNNARTLYSDLGNYYTSQGSTNWQANTIGDASTVPTAAACGNLDPTTQISPTAFVLCDTPTGQPCVTMTTTDDGNITIATAGGTTVCDAVDSDPVMQALVGTHSLGGVQIEKR